MAEGCRRSHQFFLFGLDGRSHGEVYQWADGSVLQGCTEDVVACSVT
jgi:hypothetical protein